MVRGLISLVIKDLFPQGKPNEPRMEMIIEKVHELDRLTMKLSEEMQALMDYISDLEKRNRILRKAVFSYGNDMKEDDFLEKCYNEKTGEKPEKKKEKLEFPQKIEKEQVMIDKIKEIELFGEKKTIEKRGFFFEKLIEIERTAEKNELHKILLKNETLRKHCRTLSQENLELKSLLWDYQVAFLKIQAKTEEISIISQI